MSAQLFQGYSSTKRIRLPEDKVKIDVKTPIGASTMGTLIRAQKAGDYENVGNALQLHEVVSTVDDTPGGKTVVGIQEIVVLKYSTGAEHKVMDPANAKTLMDKGYTLVETIHQDIMG